MDKPKKLDKVFGCTGNPRDRAFYKEGYNDCWEDWEKWLPNEEEIAELAWEHINCTNKLLLTKQGGHIKLKDIEVCTLKKEFNVIAKAIYNRLRGNKQ